MKKLIGLTGKTGAGKSTISKYLQQKGAYIVDGDIVARNVLVTDKSLVSKLCDAFGNVLNDDGTLNRGLVARAAFSTPENTEKLNSIMHPAINDAIGSLAKEGFSGSDVVVVDAAAIIESGFADKCDCLVVAQAPEEVRLLRIMKRDNISEEDALVRIKGQKSDDFYNSKADFIINCYEPYSVEEQLSELEKILF